MSQQTKAKYTPGPWRTNDDRDMGVYAGGRQRICCVDEVYMDRAERIANRNLIAAAPELYEALYDALPIIRDEAPNFPLLINRMDSALAKARGESS